MAVSDFYKPALVVDMVKVPDGKGGYTHSFAPRLEFKALIERSSTGESIIAAQLGITQSFTMFCGLLEDVKHNDLIQYEGKYYRVSSNSIVPPQRSAIKAKQYTLAPYEV